MWICGQYMKIQAVDASRPDSCQDIFVFNLSNSNAYYVEKYSNSDRS